MSDDHVQLVAELRALTETVLDRVEPILRKAADPLADQHEHSDDTANPEADASQADSGCSWCPVCAVAALVRGEQHDLVTLVVGQLSALIALLRQLLDEYWPRNVAGPDETAAEPEPAEPRSRSGRFVPISVTIRT